MSQIELNELLAIVDTFRHAVFLQSLATDVSLELNVSYLALRAVEEDDSRSTKMRRYAGRLANIAYSTEFV